MDAAYHLWDENPFWCLPPCTLCILDEVGFLDASRFDRICTEWLKADQEHALLCVGDSQQCAPPGGPPASTPPGFKDLLHYRLDCNFRAKDAGWRHLLRSLRVRAPFARKLRRLIGRRVLAESAPTSASLIQYLEQHPDGVLLAVRRADVAHLNALVVSGLYEAKDRLGHCTLDGSDAAELIMYKGMRVMITANADKAAGLVNGTMATVQNFTAGGLVLELLDGRRGVLPRLSREVHGARRVGYPVTHGYALTIAKAQGQTLPSAAIWPVHGMPGQAYAAVSRCCSVEDVFWVTRPQRTLFSLALHS